MAAFVCNMQLYLACALASTHASIYVYKYIFSCFLSLCLKLEQDSTSACRAPHSLIQANKQERERTNNNKIEKVMIS